MQTQPQPVDDHGPALNHRPAHDNDRSYDYGGSAINNAARYHFFDYDDGDRYVYNSAYHGPCDHDDCTWSHVYVLTVDEYNALVNAAADNCTGHDTPTPGHIAGHDSPAY